MAISGIPDPDGRKTGWADYVEVDGKLQPKPRGMTPDLTITESTLWKITMTKGFFKKEPEIMKLTNLRAIRGNQSVMLKDCEDIVARNVRQKSGGSVGDVQFIKHGSPAVTFDDIEDPYKIAEMAKAANEKVLAMIRDAQKAHAEKGIVCSQCNRENPARSKFCGRCGHAL